MKTQNYREFDWNTNPNERLVGLKQIGFIENDFAQASKTWLSPQSGSNYDICLHNQWKQGSVWSIRWIN